MIFVFAGRWFKLSFISRKGSEREFVVPAFAFSKIVTKIFWMYGVETKNLSSQTRVDVVLTASNFF